MRLREYKRAEVFSRVGVVKVRGAKREHYAHVKSLASAFSKVVEEKGCGSAELVVLPRGKGIRSGFDALGRPYLAISEDLLKTVKPSDVEFLSSLSFKDEATPLNSEVLQPLQCRQSGKTSIPIPLTPEVERAIERRLADRKTLERAFRRYEKVRKYVEDQLRKAGLPEELALLPVVESAYWKGAVSPKGAAGIWQLIPDTARRYGLKVNEQAVERYLRGEISLKELSKLDERFDLVKSTRAAIKHLKHLYKMFNGNLDLVLAAYNAGENREALKKMKDFWKEKRMLPEETQRYVPDFYAVVLLYKDRQKYALLDRDRKQAQALEPSAAPSL